MTEAFGDEREIHADDLPEFKTMLAPGARAKPAVVTVEQDADKNVESAVAALRKALNSDMNLNEVIELIEQAVIVEAHKRHKSIREISAAIGVARAKISRVLESGT